MDKTVWKKSCGQGLTYFCMRHISPKVGWRGEEDHCLLVIDGAFYNTYIIGVGDGEDCCLCDRKGSL